MPTTTRLALPYPASTDSPAGYTQIQNLANALDNAAIDLAEGTLAARPAPSIRGRWYYATDVAILYRDSGSTWRAVAGADVITAAEIAPNTITNAEVAAGAGIAYSKLALANAIVNGDIAAGAGIAYSKLALANAIVNGDIAAAAAIAYSKLNLVGSIVNTDVATAAAIAESKLALASDAAAGTASRRTLGAGPLQAAPGNDARLSDQRAPKGPEANLKIIRGRINANATIAHGSGFTVVSPGVGRYTITFTAAFSGAPAVTASVNYAAIGDYTGEAQPVTTAIIAAAVGSCEIAVKLANALSDHIISFIAIGPA